MTRFMPIQFAIATAIVLGTVVTAPAATKPRASRAHTPSSGDTVAPGAPPTRRDSDNPVQTGGGSLGYNQMLRVY